MTPTHRSGTRPVGWVLIGVAVVAWGAVGRLAWAFVSSDLTLRLVAENSRRDAPWAYRLAALWGNAPGSLLLFAAIVTTVGYIGTRGLPMRGPALVASTGAVLTAVALVAGHPFQRLDAPALRGFGLTPILEHPAMAIHPPLLYLGLAATLPAWAHAVARGSSSVARRWLLTAMSVITLAMTLGAWWSYAEQGWGGYWAWDPVENGSLAPWLACVVVVHLRSRPAPRWTWGIAWCLALGGGAIARSGAVRSVHTFAEAPLVGWTLAGVALAAAIACGWRWSDPPPTSTSPGSAASLGSSASLASLGSSASPGSSVSLASEASLGSSASLASPGSSAAISRWARYPVILASAVGVVVVVGTVAPLVAHWSGGRTLSIGGEFFARLIAPLAVTAVAAFGVLAASRSRRVVANAGWVSHAGFAVLVVGIIATTFDRSGTATLGDGESATIAGLTVRNDGVTVRPGRRDDTDEVAVTLNVAGHTMSPALTAYPERGGILAETALISRPSRDIQAVLLDADDSGRAVVEIRSKPLVQFVWFGALLVAFGTLVASRGRSGRGSAPMIVSDRTPDAVEVSDHVQ